MVIKSGARLYASRRIGVVGLLPRDRRLLHGAGPRKGKIGLIWVLAAQGGEVVVWKEVYRVLRGGKYHIALKNNFLEQKKDCSNSFSHMVSHYSTL